MTKKINALAKIINKYSPEILTGIGIAGMISSTVMAVKATPKAISLIKKAENNKLESLGGYSKCSPDECKLTTKEIIKVTGKCYGPSVLMILVSAGCIIGATTTNSKKNAVLAATCSMTEEAFREYRTKVVETIGSKKEEVIRDAIARDNIEKNPVKTNEVIVTGNGASLCYESVSGRYFQSDIESLRRAENKINKVMFNDMYASLNDFYYEIGLDCTDIGDCIGWNVNKGLVDLSFSSQLTANGTPCLVVNYFTPPSYGYDEY